MSEMSSNGGDSGELKVENENGRIRHLFDASNPSQLCTDAEFL